MAGFYDSLAEVQHLVFANWENSIEWQAAALGPLIENACGVKNPRVLDCACGIGTQSLALAGRGHRVTSSDLCSSAVARARREAAARGLEIEFHIADFRELGAIPGLAFDAVLAVDNALPHLENQAELERAARSIASKLRPCGVFIASIRDYDRLLEERPTSLPPAFFKDGGRTRIVHQVWDWQGERAYAVHLYITREIESGWECSHHAGIYYALKRAELTASLAAAGFGEIRWLTPEESGFYQPLVVARRPPPAPSLQYP